MPTETLFLSAAIVVFFGCVAYMIARMFRPSSATASKLPGVVEQYRLTVVDRGGFPRVVLALETAKGTAEYEFQPPYAYVLSNELLMTAANAAPRSKPAAQGIAGNDFALARQPARIAGVLPDEGEL